LQESGIFFIFFYFEVVTEFPSGWFVPLSKDKYFWFDLCEKDDGTEKIS